MLSPSNTTLWQQLQAAWSAGDLTTARERLAQLLTEADFKAAPWGMWGDTAVALGDFELAQRAYQQAAANRYTLHYLYARLHTAAPSDNLTAIVQAVDQYRPSPDDSGEQLLHLALQTELHFRRADIRRAAHAGANLLKRWGESGDGDLGFLDYLKPHVWLLLARVAEAAGNAPVASRCLDRLAGLDDSTPPSSITVLLAALLGRTLDAAGSPPPDEQLAAHLETLLSADYADVRPAIPDSLRESLQKTAEALTRQGQFRLRLLTEAIDLRRTNLLARCLYVDELARQGQEIDHILAREANLWLTVKQPRYKRALSRYLLRPQNEVTTSTFSFMALGGGSTVGGSAYLFGLSGANVLVDAGLDVTTAPQGSYARLKQNLQQAEGVNNLADINAVIISHAHLDHVGLLPLLHSDPELPRVKTRAGIKPQLNFYATSATREIAQIMLEDSSRIAQANQQPLYSIETVAATLNDVRPLPDDGLLSRFHDWGKVTFFESGHILGARMLLLEKDGLRILHTGDLNTRPQFSLPAAHPLKGLQPDLLVMESTYGYNPDEWTLPRRWQEQVFIESVDRVLRRDGVVLIPAFAVGRSQEVLGLVAHHAQQNPDLFYRIYLDGLARSVTACYDRFATELSEQYRDLRRWIDYRLVHVSDNTDRTKLVQAEVVGRPAVIIASSGMLKKGSLSYQYALQLAADPRNAIFYSGYLAEDSEAVDFLHREVDDLANAGLDIQCEQQRFYFSAHAPKEDLLQFVFDVQPRAVVLVHGDASQRARTADNLFALLKQLENETFKVFIGREGRSITFKQGSFQQS